MDLGVSWSVCSISVWRMRNLNIFIFIFLYVTWLVLALKYVLFDFLKNFMLLFFRVSIIFLTVIEYHGILSKDRKEIYMVVFILSVVPLNSPWNQDFSWVMGVWNYFSPSWMTMHSRGIVDCGLLSRGHRVSVSCA